MKSPACALSDRLSTRGIWLEVRNGRLWVRPQEGYAALPDHERAAIREHRDELKLLVHGGYVSEPPAATPRPAQSVQAKPVVGPIDAHEAYVLETLRSEGDEVVAAYLAGRLSKADAYDRARCRARQERRMACGPARWSKSEIR